MHFPESALSGCVKTHIKDWSTFDWKLLEDQLNKIGALCADLNIWAVFGSAHSETIKKRPYNSLFVFDNFGNLQSRYDKRYCSHTEITDWYRAGSSPIIIDVYGIKLGLAICIEIQFPEIFQEYERLDVDGILLSAYSDRRMFAIQSQGHAACNNYWLSLSVPSNLSHKQPSCLIGPDGKIIDRCKNGSPDVIVHKIDPNAAQWDIPCKKARPWRRKARHGVIYK